MLEEQSGSGGQGVSRDTGLLGIPGVRVCQGVSGNPGCP